ncbi:ATP synthase mitochondrial F1 complex assembly factor 1-like [Macrosteles quadrilineatus]|uniref:ATP synthase mitochondrial F1 complex assembly factor 1-like n=1 Tax=Macrosteles quadrilineatus TaxID=74068 RepID=UPI0023E26BAE|nr:ATP synthase mitochondrial F1 complex assembly factor 1-like [Macrosteles quadrilineatus]
MFKVVKSALNKQILFSKQGSISLNCLGLLARGLSITNMNLERAAEELQNNPYFDKYAEKIAQLQKTSPEEFMARLKENEERKTPKKQDNISKSTPMAGLPGKAKVGSVPFTKPKLLSDVMKTELIEGKSAAEIRDIWIEYHKNKDCIAASVPVAKFELIQSRGEKFPIFVLPLPRDQGYEFIMCQFAGNEVHFTPLISYQTHKENAPECLTMIYYPDLKDHKDIVLMKGEFNKDILTVIEAQCLANELQLYYGEENEKRTGLLERFTHSPEDFKHMDLIANLETLSF